MAVDLMVDPFDDIAGCDDCDEGFCPTHDGDLNDRVAEYE
jgi:hypothetical protein